MCCLEERSIELIAGGHSIGESFDLEVTTPDGDQNIGSVFNLFFVCTIPDGKEPPILKISRSNGLDCPEAELRPGEIQGGKVKYMLPLILSGDPGRSMLRLIVKGDRYFATLGLVDINLEVRPPRTTFSLVDGPIRWDGGPGKKLNIRMSNLVGSRVRGDLNVSLVPHGDTPSLQDRKLNISYKGTKEMELELDELGSVHGELDLVFKLRTKESLETSTLDRCIKISSEGAISDEAPIMEEKGSPYLNILSARFDPGTIQPGSRTIFFLDIERENGLEGEVTGSIRIGSKEIPIRIPIGETTFRMELTIHSRMKGPVTPVLKLECQGSEPVRSVLSKSLVLKGSSQLDIRLVSVLDAQPDQKVEHSRLLFPGETVVGSRSLKESSVMDLSTGRHLYLHKGSVVFGPGWDPAMTDEAMMGIFALEFREMTLSPEVIRKMRKGADRVSLSTRVINTLGGSDYPDMEKSIIIGPLLSRIKEKGGLKTPKVRVKGLTNDPVPIIHNHISSLMSNVVSGKNSAEYLEHLIQDMRSAPSPPISASGQVMKALVNIINERIVSLTDDRMDRSTLIDLYLGAIIFSLVRIEVLSSWTDPVLGAWDELRIERQRALKMEINSLLDLMGSLVDAHTSLVERSGYYKDNMLSL